MLNLQTFVLLAATSLVAVAAKKQVEVTTEAIFDISIGNQPKGTVVIALFGHEVPKTVANFARLASSGGFKGHSYRNSIFHRVIPDFMIQGGDIIQRDGRGSISIYGGKFRDENFNIKHSEPGLVSMANSGPNSNGSQFFITLAATPWLDGKHTVFGKVVSGMDIMNEVASVQRDSNDRPLQEVTITRSVVRPVNARLLIPTQ